MCHKQDLYHRQQVTGVKHPQSQKQLSCWKHLQNRQHLTSQMHPPGTWKRPSWHPQCLRHVACPKLPRAQMHPQAAHSVPSQKRSKRRSACANRMFTSISNAGSHGLEASQEPRPQGSSAEAARHTSEAPYTLGILQQPQTASAAGHNSLAFRTQGMIQQPQAASLEAASQHLEASRTLGTLQLPQPSSEQAATDSTAASVEASPEVQHADPAHSQSQQLKACANLLTAESPQAPMHPAMSHASHKSPEQKAKLPASPKPEATSVNSGRASDKNNASQAQGPGPGQGHAHFRLCCRQEESKAGTSHMLLDGQYM